MQLSHTSCASYEEEWNTKSCAMKYNCAHLCRTEFAIQLPYWLRWALGCEPRDYTSLKIMETWFRWLPIYQISQVRLCLLRRCCRWGLLYQAIISGSCWIGGLRKTWVPQVGKISQQMVLFPRPLWLNRGDGVAPNEGGERRLDGS